jgi:Domain of Unknown Function (DUF1080)
LFDYPISRRAFAALAAAPVALVSLPGEWANLFDGKTLTGWRPSENKSSWKVVDGLLTADGPRSHLFYTGPVRAANFKNFELEAELITQPDCNSGVYFHTAYQERGFPEKGFEVQVNNTARGDGGYLERKKTGSLYGIRNMYKQLVPDQKPFRMHISVRGKNVQIRLNNELLVDYIEPTPPVIPEGGEKLRFLDRGTFALQCHNDGSRVAYRSVRVRPLPDDLPAYTAAPPVADDVYRRIINIGRHNVPMVDFHVFIRPGMTLEDVLRKSRNDGLQYGITTATTTISGDAHAQRWLNSLSGRPVFCALYAADRQWMRTISRKSAQGFDYILADNRIWMDGQKQPVPLWMPGAANRISNRQEFLDRLVEQAVDLLNTEPIDIYAFPTYLPAFLRPEANSLWTESRVTKLIDALLKNQVAVEINTGEQLPSRRFIEQAKQAGCKFALGTANQTADALKRCEYGLEMIEACKLDWHNIFAPGAWWPKAAARRWPS